MYSTADPSVCLDVAIAALKVSVAPLYRALKVTDTVLFQEFRLLIVEPGS